jgi:polyisoprenoid-binding protein YceI
MKKVMYLSICLLLPNLLWATPTEVKVKGNASFTSEAPLEKIEGTATSSGTLQVDLEDFTAIRGEINVPVSSMETGNKTRDEHLRGSDWLDASKCPNVSFKIESVEVKKRRQRKQKRLESS